VNDCLTAAIIVFTDEKIKRNVIQAVHQERLIHIQFVIPEWFYRGSGFIAEVRTIFPMGALGNDRSFKMRNHTITTSYCSWCKLGSALITIFF
jgi:hypothetical protein